MRRALVSLACGAAACCVLAALNLFLGPAAHARAEAERLETMRLLTHGETFTPAETSDDIVRAAWRTERGWLLETVTRGYAGDITLWVGVSDAGAVTGLCAREMHETPGLGQRAFTEGAFLDQMIGRTGGVEAGVNADAITGATVTSRALAKAVNAACGFVTGVDTETAATTWEG